MVLPLTDTLALALLHTPPVAASLNPIELPTHTLDGPEIVPALGHALMVSIVVATTLPQPFVTV